MRSATPGMPHAAAGPYFFCMVGDQSNQNTALAADGGTGWERGYLAPFV
jgi:hypothetical protein